MRGLELPEAGGVAECYLSASGPAILRVRQGHQAAQAEAPHHSRLHRSGWSGLTLCSRLSKYDNTGPDSLSDLPFSLWLVRTMTVNNAMTNQQQTNDVTTYTYQNG